MSPTCDTSGALRPLPYVDKKALLQLAADVELVKEVLRRHKALADACTPEWEVREDKDVDEDDYVEMRVADKWRTVAVIRNMDTTEQQRRTHIHMMVQGRMLAADLAVTIAELLTQIQRVSDLTQDPAVRRICEQALQNTVARFKPQLTQISKPHDSGTPV